MLTKDASVCCRITIFASLELKAPKLFQHDSVPVNKVRFMKSWFAKTGVEILACPSQSPDISPTEHLTSRVNLNAHYMPRDLG